MKQNNCISEGHSIFMEEKIVTYTYNLIECLYLQLLMLNVVINIYIYQNSLKM